MTAYNETVITPNRKLLDLRLDKVWKYKSLIYMLVRRDLVTYYKQTVLGPLWYLISPVCSTVMYMIVFGNIARLGTDSIPQPLFYFSGNILWSFFSLNLVSIATVFEVNKGLFGKVYFPRIVAPISTTIVAMVKLGIQFLLFLAVYIYFMVKGEVAAPDIKVLLSLLVVIWIAFLTMGIGLSISAVTSKYKDMGMMVTPLTALLMYASPVVYPVSEIHGILKTLLCLNPMSAPIEIFRYAFFGTASIPVWSVVYSAVFSIAILFIGIILFNKNEQTFIDVI